MNSQALFPGLLSESRIAFAILRFPRVPFAHAQKRHTIAE